MINSVTSPECLLPYKVTFTYSREDMDVFWATTKEKNANLPKRKEIEVEGPICG